MPLVTGGNSAVTQRRRSDSLHLLTCQRQARQLGSLNFTGHFIRRVMKRRREVPSFVQRRTEDAEGGYSSRKSVMKRASFALSVNRIRIRMDITADRKPSKVSPSVYLCFSSQCRVK